MLDAHTLNHPDGSAELLRFGTHVLRWQPTGQAHPVLYVSPTAVLDGSKAIRGGIPVCFPWFGPHPTDTDAPSHGRVRTAMGEWGQRHPDRGSVTWTGDTFGLRLAATLSETLHIDVDVVNRSGSPARFELALHSYFAVGGVQQVRVQGLDGLAYLDQLTGTRHQQGAEPVTFAAEFDRIYFGRAEGAAPVRIEDPAWARQIVLNTEGLPSAVVWNPWTEKARRLSDLPDDAWPDFCCVEAGCVGEDAVELAPGAGFSGSLTLAVEAGS